MAEPIILVVDDDPQVLAAIRRDLRSRYRADYRVLAANSGEAALDAVKELKARGDTLAMLISDQRMPAMLGVDLLTRCREIYPVARRVLLTAYSDVKAAVRAINEAHLDHYFEKPWDPPEEHLFPAIDELLAAWQAEYRPEVTGLRLVGHQWSPRSHQVKDFLASNLIPYRWLDVERDPEARQLLEASGVAPHELPTLLLENGRALRNPDQQQLAENLGLATSAAHELYDLVIVGAGPAGLAAAVYGASEGMRTLLLDGHGPGGQAAASSRIENYLGFPSGVSGSELTRRALAQAQRFGAEFLVPVSVTGLSVDRGYKRLRLDEGREIVTRALIAATGMSYREHEASGIADFTGAGVYYGAAVTEAHSCRERRVVVIGGGNSAGHRMFEYGLERLLSASAEKAGCNTSGYGHSKTTRSSTRRPTPCSFLSVRARIAAGCLLQFFGTAKDLFSPDVMWPWQTGFPKCGRRAANRCCWRPASQAFSQLEMYAQAQ